MEYKLCIMHLMSLHPMVVPMQMLCKMRIMHHYIMHYEKVNCITCSGIQNGREFQNPLYKCIPLTQKISIMEIPNVRGLRL